MAVSANYPSPVFVNGFSCRNCTDVDYANKNIDPARPADGPFGVNADKSHDAKTPGKDVFDRAKIAATIAAAQSAGAQGGTAGQSSGYGAPAKVETGQLVNRAA